MIDRMYEYLRQNARQYGIYMPPDGMMPSTERFIELYQGLQSGQVIAKKPATQSANSAKEKEGKHG